VAAGGAGGDTAAVTTRYPPIEPHDHGWLDVGDGHRLYWETCGRRDGLPAVVLHGGPGAGAGPGLRRYFDPDAYRIVLFDQRGCGRSTPHAGAATVDLSTNTTHHLVADVERLRQHLGVERWLVFGGSWGSTLGLAYAEAHPERVAALVLYSVVTTTAREVDWVTRDMGRVFPAEWARFRDAVPAAGRGDRLVDAYARLLHDADAAVRDAAARAWCAWEDTHVSLGRGHRPDPRFDDPAFRLAFARLVTHYWRHAAWLEDGALVRDAHRLRGIPGALVHGRLDVSGPPDIAWQIAQIWTDASLTWVDDAGHGGEAMADVLVATTDKLARLHA